MNMAEQPITRVINMSTEQELSYSLPPEKAVVCAHEQYSRRNWNTWSYDFSKARASVSGRTVSCGDWVTLVI
ncbi:hypothetical protein [Thioalkalivibrio thiocyanodenitrificans]|uniref:hypothetical protein n=1 Tax=Thioalkalivibrio thiocyanodenitrificans TaxID=243063 RepID=UPI000377AAF2|nr:hypothetical protein [Thioalkalivibrio thiocyanodenitrificans]